jgi:hypothetical protein
MSAVTTHKSPKIAQLIADCHGCALPAHYLGYFKCFDAGLYYEAHDVLEELWLGARGGDYFFYKGLIQFAGAFVHLQSDRRRPAHQLFTLALRNLKPFRPTHHDLDVAALVAGAERYRDLGYSSDFKVNALRELGPFSASALLIQAIKSQGTDSQ